MPEDWIPNVATQIERAIRALFISKGAASASDCFISNESTDRAGIATGITTIRANTSTTSESELSGRETITVTIQNKFAARDNPAESNNDAARIEMDKRVGRQMTALMQGGTVSGDLNFACADINEAGRALATSSNATVAANNADMSEFTVTFGRYLGLTRGEPEDDSAAWVEVRTFEFKACPYNVS